MLLAAPRFLVAAGAAAPAGEIMVLGPAEAPLALIRGRHRFRLLAKAPRSAPLQSALRAWRDSVKPEPGVSVRIDIDPQSFL